MQNSNSLNDCNTKEALVIGIEDALEIRGNEAGGTSELHLELTYLARLAAQLCDERPGNDTAEIAEVCIHLARVEVMPNTPRSWKPYLILAGHGLGAQQRVLDLHMAS